MNTNKIKMLIETIASSSGVIIGGSPVITDWEQYTFIKGEPDNDVFLFMWTHEDVGYTEVLNEGDLSNAKIIGNELHIKEAEGEEDLVIELFLFAPQMIPSAPAENS